MGDLRKLTISQMASGLRKRTFSAVELVEEHINAKDEFNAFVTFTHDVALEAARKVDAEISAGRGDELHYLAGIPVGIKDLFCTNGIRTTACSKMLSNFVPKYESTVSGLLRGTGAAMIGKTNMDEFAMGSANVNSYYGNVLNPWGKSVGKNLVPGGSSGGSAAAVSGFLCAGALGSDTGGSVRQPASFCGIVGVKPTYGRCSRYGIISFASSLDQAGVFARSVDDAYAILSSIVGYDSKDSTLSNIPSFSGSKLCKSVKGKKIGVLNSSLLSGISSDVFNVMQNSISKFIDGGAEIVNIDIPYLKDALAVYYVVASAEASTNLSRYDGVRYGFRAEDCSTLDEMYVKTRTLGFGSEVKRRILLGTYVLSSGCYDLFFKKASLVREMVSHGFQAVFDNGIDCIFLPTSPTVAFGIDEIIGKVEMYFNDFFTVPVSLAGLPGVSVPAGLSEDGLPIGMQIVGKRNMEPEMMGVAGFLEDASGYFVPPML